MPHRGRRQGRCGKSGMIKDIHEEDFKGGSDIYETNTGMGTSSSQSEYKMQDIELNKIGAELTPADAKYETLAKIKCEAHAEPHAEAYEPYADAYEDSDKSDGEGSSSLLGPWQALKYTKMECVIASRYLLEGVVQDSVLTEEVFKVREWLTLNPRPTFEEASRMLSFMEKLRTEIETMID